MVSLLESIQIEMAERTIETIHVRARRRHPRSAILDDASTPHPSSYQTRLFALYTRRRNRQSSFLLVNNSRPFLGLRIRWFLGLLVTPLALRGGDLYWVGIEFTGSALLFCSEMRESNDAREPWEVVESLAVVVADSPEASEVEIAAVEKRRRYPSPCIVQCRSRC